MSNSAVNAAPVITPEQLLAHWQGHRRVTRRVIEAFPEDQLFSYAVAPMRTFGELVLEFLAMDVPTLEELTSEQPRQYETPKVQDKAELLRLWDEHSRRIDELWPRLPAEVFQETRTIFGQFTSQVWDLLWYVIDNEIHHRGQGYVYLRALGIEPPPFYVRD
ncbi:MAG TPA: DinB family protein [Longimicrobiaceae bacterium]